MGPTAERLAALKQYMVVEGDEDDVLIVSLYAAAVDYLPAPTTGQPALYDLALNGLVLGWYDDMRRGDGGGRTESILLRRIINGLKFGATEGDTPCP